MPENKTISRKLYDNLLDCFRSQRKYLIGRLLTITDGVGRDDVQRKALKNLLENEIWRFSTEMEVTFSNYCCYLALAIKEPESKIPTDRGEVPRVGAMEKVYNPLTD